MDRRLRQHSEPPPGDDAIPAARLAEQVALALPRAEAVITAIHKNASTELRYSVMVDRGIMPADEPFDGYYSDRRRRRQVNATPRQLATAAQTFVTLRCPFSRLASCFLEKAVEDKKTFVSLRRRIEQSAPDRAVTFRTFVQWLEDSAVLRGNVHWRPQIEFLIYEDYDHWLQLEDHTGMTRVLAERIGLTLRETRHLAQHGQNRFTQIDGSFADSSTRDLLARRETAGETPTPGSLYDAALIEQVARLYADDLALYVARFGEARLLPNRARASAL